MIAMFTFECILNVHFLINKDNVKLDVERGEGIIVGKNQEDLIKTVNYIQNNVPTEGKIFVGNVRHDRINANAEIIYFLANRQSATKYSDTHPGVVTTQPVQNEIINELEKNNVKYIVLYSGYENAKVYGKSNESSGVNDLDIFIKNHYHVVKIYGNYTIFAIDSIEY
ncbi:MAG: hypothetical protein ABFC34_10355 [Methanobacterium sp.]